MKITDDYKKEVRKAIMANRKNHTGSDNAYATHLGIGNSIYSRLKKGEIDKLLSDSMWLEIGMDLEVELIESTWKTVRTTVYNEIENNILFCKNNNKSMILVDDCGIGKTHCAKHILRRMQNAFYVDCSQAKTKQQFIRVLAKTVGVKSQGRFIDIKKQLKYALKIMENPIIVLDEAGDLIYGAFLELKEMWNGTEGSCGWYMMGADGLRAKIKKGINSEKVGYAEIFSRFSDEFVELIPNGADDRRQYYTQLLGTVAKANLTDQSKLNAIVKKCILKGSTLRYLETVIKVHS